MRELKYEGGEGRNESDRGWGWKGERLGMSSESSEGGRRREWEMA